MCTKLLSASSIYLSVTLLLIAAPAAHAKGVRVVVEQMTAINLTSGEPGSEDETYFTAAGATSQGRFSRPRIGPGNDDHWDMKQGQTIFNFDLYHGFLGSGESAFLTFVMRESDGGALSALASVLQSTVNLILPVVTSGFSLDQLIPLISIATNFANSLSSDHDDTVGAFAVAMQNVNGSLMTRVADARTSTTTSLGGNRFEVSVTGAGARYRLILRVEQYNGVTLQNPNGLCLDVPSGTTADGVQIQQYPCHGGPNQRWLVIPFGANSLTTSSLTIINEQSGKCLDVRGAAFNYGAAIQQFACHGGTNQTWYFRFLLGPMVQLQNDNSQLCMDIPNATSSIIGIQQYTCGNGPPSTKSG